jgi:hypothetical protein
MTNFKIIYKILRFLDAAMDCEEVDYSEISPFQLGVTRERWERVLIAMQDEGYIKGLVLGSSLTDNRRHIAEPIQPEITIKGMEFLANNGTLKKAAEALKTAGSAGSGAATALIGKL